MLPTAADRPLMGRELSDVRMAFDPKLSDPNVHFLVLPGRDCRQRTSHGRLQLLSGAELDMIPLALLVGDPF